MEGFLLEANIKCNILRLQKLRHQGLKMLGSAAVMEKLIKVREEHARQLSTNTIPGEDLPAKISSRMAPGGTTAFPSTPLAPALSQPRRCTAPLDILGLP